MTFEIINKILGISSTSSSPLLRGDLGVCFSFTHPPIHIFKSLLERGFRGVFLFPSFTHPPIHIFKSLLERGFRGVFLFFPSFTHSL